MTSKITEITTDELYYIADKTYDFENCNYIIDQILTSLSNTSSQSRKALNILNLVDFLMKNGSAKFKGEMEDEKYFFKKIKEFYNDPYDVLHSPIRNIIDRLIELIENPDLLKKEREDAKKIKEKLGKNIEGISNEGNSKYKGFSSDDVKNDGDNKNVNSSTYDIRPEINLEKKLGLEIPEKKDKIEEQKKENVQEVNEINFLDDGKEEKVQEVTKVKKKKKFLPPPPKKKKNGRPQYKRKENAKNKQNDMDLLNLNNITNINQTEEKKEEPLKQVKQELLEFNFLQNEENTPKNVTQNEKPSELLDFTLQKEPVKKNDFLDLNNLGAPKKEETKIDDYLNLLSKAQNIPISNTVDSNNANYDFL